MAYKVVFVCAFAVMVQSIAGLSCYRPTSQSNCGCGSIGSGSVSVVQSSSSRLSRPAILPSPISSTCQSIDIPQSGGPLVVSSVGPISPTGIAVATDLDLFGDLYVSGALPYLTAVAFEGEFPTESIVPVSYGCGDVVAITETIGGSVGQSTIGGINTGYSGYASNRRTGCGC